MASNAIPLRRPTETSITAFHQAFSRFRAAVEATTIPVDGGRRIDGIAHSVVISQQTGQLLDAIFEVRTYLADTYGTTLTDYPAGLVLKEADSLEGPWTEVPATEIEIKCVPIEPQAFLMAALESTTRLLAQSPDSCGHRWNVNEVVADEELARIESAASLLTLHEGLFDQLGARTESSAASTEPPETKAHNDIASDDGNAGYSAELNGNQISDPSPAMTAGQLARQIWGLRNATRTQIESAKKRVLAWMKYRRLPANRVGHGLYVVSLSALKFLESSESKT